MKLLPRTLLWRTFLLVALLMLLSVAAWFAIFRSLRARTARPATGADPGQRRQPDARRADLRPSGCAPRTVARVVRSRGHPHLSGRSHDRIEPLPDRPFLHRVEELVREQLGPGTRLSLEREGEQALFVSFRIDDSDEGDYWLALPRERIDRMFPLGWLGWGVAALLLSLLGAWLIVFRITRPLKALQEAAQKVGAGETPPRLDESGADRIGDRRPCLQPDERRPGADRPGSRPDPGRRLARSAHAADAPAHGHRNVRRRRPARRHDGRHRGNGQDHRPVPRLRAFRGRRSAAGSRSRRLAGGCRQPIPAPRLHGGYGGRRYPPAKRNPGYAERVSADS